jgi:aminodeoxyfutalosine synthase
MHATDLDSLLERAGAGDPLGTGDRRLLLQSPDLLGLGMAADQARRRRHGTRITFVRVAEVPFGTVTPDPASWAAAGEVRITGTPTEWADGAAFVARVRAAAPTDVPVSGFSLAALAESCGFDTAPLTALARRLHEAGLDLVAEAPLDRLERAEPVVDAVTAGGLRVMRLTVDHAAADRQGDLLERAHALTVARPAIMAFAPLPRRQSGAHPSTGFEDVRLVALARLLVDVPHIQVDWPLYGPKLAQVGLTFGADDVDGVSPLEETGQGRRRAPQEEIRRNIRAASAEPRERDGRFALRD